MKALAENYNDYGDYSEELVYQSKSRIRRFFSFRTLKTILKALGILIILLVYGLLFFRLCTGSPPKRLSDILWTEKLYTLYTENGGTLVAYTQEPTQNVAKDGYFGVYDIIYLPEADEFQLTVRYNNSSIEKLRDMLHTEALEERKKQIREEIRAENPDVTDAEIDSLATVAYELSLAENPVSIELSAQPFVFILRDDMGRIYTSYQYIRDSKNVYQYLRISFSGVNLFGTEKSVPERAYPSPETPVPGYLYKGPNQADSDAIRYLYLDMYYENDVDLYGESFAYPLLVYRNAYELESYNMKKVHPTGINEGLVSAEIKDTP